MGIPITIPQSGIEVFYTSVLKDIWLWVILHLRRSTPAKPSGGAFVNEIGLNGNLFVHFYSIRFRRKK
jgi:hypothetical protein